MTDAEKIIADAVRELMPGADGEPDSRTFATFVAAALREAGMLTETEWEYGYDHGSGSVCIYESADEARKFEDADEHIVKRRVGPWEPVEGDPR